MKPLIAFPLEGDDSILVEVEELPTTDIDEGLVANYPGQQVVVKARTSFADAMDKIKPVAANIIGKVRELKPTFRTSNCMISDYEIRDGKVTTKRNFQYVF